VPAAGRAPVAPPDGAGARDVAAVLAASAAIGILDTQLRTATDFALGRVLYGRPVAGLPLVRATLTAAFVDLLAADGLVTAAAEAVHAGPEQADAVAPVAALLVPELLLDADRRLAALLGARSFLREGPQATFQLNSRELRTLGNRLAAFGPTPPTRTGPLPAACRQAVLAHTPAELLGDHDWARAGRQRFADLLGPARQAAEPATDDRLFAELSDRHRDFRSFDLADRVLV
ncbi:acyl-CoA dehydrogenase family protein, partial [Kitasatospora sp. NPDC097643]|uniref:acyl-CoA dehydrogenase family protein n=1 Tax=Kitasatospora sp. NPDC097643 TaxID=3157230 RepID=UPI00332A4A25